MMAKVKFRIQVVVDTNDADHAELVSSISEKDLDKIRPLIERIAAFKTYNSKSKSGSKWTHHHNYPYGECLREDLGEKSPRDLYEGIDEEAFDIFEELCPPSEYGFHTIVKIQVWPDVATETLLG
jgi:hypothetical protein